MNLNAKASNALKMDPTVLWNCNMEESNVGWNCEAENHNFDPVFRPKVTSLDQIRPDLNKFILCLIPVSRPTEVHLIDASLNIYHGLSNHVCILLCFIKFIEQQ